METGTETVVAPVAEKTGAAYPYWLLDRRDWKNCITGIRTFFNDDEIL